MKFNIDNSAGVISAVVVLILSLCMLRFHILQKEKFNDSLFNNKLIKEYEAKFKFSNDCTPPTFKKKMFNYFKLVQKYKEQETKIFKLNDLMTNQHKNYQQTMRDLQTAKTDLDYCVNTN